MNKETLNVRERIIEQWDYDNSLLYNVWLNNDKIEVERQYAKSKLEDSILSDIGKDKAELKEIAS